MNEIRLGAFLEHVGFSSRSRVHRLAEIAEVTASGVVLYIDNDPNPRTVERFDLLRWWEVLPTKGDSPPTWVKRGAVFRARDGGISNRAVLHSVNQGWVSFFDHTRGQPQVFRIAEYAKFQTFWALDENPSVWERLLEDDLV